jgi:hypothetical protein
VLMLGLCPQLLYLTVLLLESFGTVVQRFKAMAWMAMVSLWFCKCAVALGTYCAWAFPKSLRAAAGARPPGRPIGGDIFCLPAPECFE